MTEQLRTSAKVVLDSISPDGVRLTTMEVTFHRFVLAEFNTHRVFSRNSASSRAIPVSKQLARVSATPAFPLEWPCEQPGMQGGGALAGWDLESAQRLFQQAANCATDLISGYLDRVKFQYPDLSDDELKAHTLHKSLLNRILEPFMWHTVIVSSTDWDNFFGLRCSPLAQPEIRIAAEKMQSIYKASEPKLVKFEAWHLPFMQSAELEELGVEVARKVSAARCARVSYLTHDGKRDIDADIKLYDRLTSSDPAHASPLEHVATPYRDVAVGNFTGWKQLRHFEGM